ncbi:MAG: sulfotransferase [bacterium]|nr:hypothetical protein [Deltaproteobacteria bacterium]MCP4907381.1 sulfotransferase [bacterium]
MGDTGYPRAMARSFDIPQFVDAASSHPLPIRALNRLGGLIPGNRPLSAEAIWSAARTHSLGDLEPTPEAADALEVLLDSLAANVRMSLVGRFSARDDTIRLARTHLRIQRALRDTAGVDSVELPRSIFIVGWPRTGSTFLHQLLACDPASRTIPYWESFDPVPPERGKPDRRVAKLEEMLGFLERIEPRYHAIHPMTAAATEECVALFMNEFRTLQFDFQYRVPEYARWLIGQDQGVAYDLYRRQLQLIQWHRPVGEWQVLKDPTHLVHLETLIERFPEARFVFTHRDPAFSISSLCSLVSYTRALFTDDVDPVAVGAEIMSGYWPSALEKGRKLRASLADGRAVDIRHPDLARDPIATAEAIYAALGLTLTEEARGAMRDFARGQTMEQKARHTHDLEGFGLTRAEVRDRFAGYCEDLEL